MASKLHSLSPPYLPPPSPHVRGATMGPANEEMERVPQALEVEHLRDLARQARLAFIPARNDTNVQQSRSPSPAARHHRGRSRSPSRSRREPRDREDYRRRERTPVNGYHGEGTQRSYEDRQVAKEQMMSNIRESSQQDRRVYVGNLAYEVGWKELKDFMRKAGDVLYADVLLLPNGMSKGCGIVEYATREQAQTAINSLSNSTLHGRLIYVREDRETEPRFQAAAPPRGGYDGGYGPRGGHGGGYGGGYGGGAMGMGGGGRQIYVSNLPYQVGWQDLKDLFRQAALTGTVVRADVHVAPDGRPKGSGIVAFDNPDDAQNAIQQFNGYDWQGRVLEVREDRFATGSGPGFGGRGGFGGGFRGGFRGGFGGGYGGRGDYGGYGGRGGFGGGYGGRGGYAGGGGYGGAPAPAPAASAVVPPNPFTDNAASGTEPGPIVFVRNLPYATSNDDLMELFVTIGKVERAEIQYERHTGRSKGTGVVEFSNNDDAATAIAKFQGYVYGNRPLGLAYVKYLTQGGDMDVGEPTGSIQDQMM